METMTKMVQFTADNVMKCQCTSCPVQGQSACAKDKMQAMSGMMDQMKSMMASGQEPMSGMAMPSPQDVPGVYCSSGTASCGDFDFSQGCVCPTCDVWTENQLNSQKYCNQGSAAQIG